MTRTETTILRWLALGLAITGAIFTVLGLAHHGRAAVRLVPDVALSFDPGYLLAAACFWLGAITCLLGSIALDLSRRNP